MKKFVKLVGILGGVIIFSEIFGTIGEVQMALAIAKVYPDAINEILDDYLNNDALKESPKYTQIKCKIVRELTKIGIENDILS